MSVENKAAKKARWHRRVSQNNTACTQFSNYLSCKQTTVCNATLQTNRYL